MAKNKKETTHAELEESRRIARAAARLRNASIFDL